MQMKNGKIVKKWKSDFVNYNNSKIDILIKNNHLNYYFDVYRGNRLILSDLKSDENGVFWVGVLPCGKYILHEKTIPNSAVSNDGGWWYELDVSEDGVSCSSRKDSRPS